ncbi:DUF5317 family protein [Peptoniphilus catoniae]|uniref:DUF5317 family protein n=1 Tax=Peptoniphilus catoniae TaxID=1660341 RepID=UPI0010FDF906|nr:DUF5317 family protein [Peptoniphilus catoniae]
MIIEALLLGLLIVKIRGNKLRDSVYFNRVSMFLAAFGILLSLFLIIFTRNDLGYFTYFFVKNYFYLHVLSLLIIALSLIINYKHLGLLIVGLGLLLNLIPIFLNGKMPVDKRALISINNPLKLEIIETNKSLSHGIFERPKAWILSDIIPLKKPYPMPKVISIGDIIISCGIIIYIYYLKE